MRLNSLAARLIATAAIWTMLGLLVGGLVLSAAFRAAALNNFDAGLRADLPSISFCWISILIFCFCCCS